MTVSTTTTSVERAGNGVARVFSFSPIRIFDETQLEVVVRDADGVLTTISRGTGANAYAVEATFTESQSSTGSIRYPEAGGTLLPTGSSISIRRVVPFTQETIDLENQGGYLPETQEMAHDLHVMRLQELQEGLSRAVQVPFGSEVDSDDYLATVQADAAAAAASAESAEDDAALAQAAATASAAYAMFNVQSQPGFDADAADHTEFFEAAQAFAPFIYAPPMFEEDGTPKPYIVKDFVPVTNLTIVGTRTILSSADPTKRVIKLEGSQSNLTFTSIDFTQGMTDIADYVHDGAGATVACVGNIAGLSETGTDNVTFNDCRVYYTGRVGIYNYRGGRYWHFNGGQIHHTARDGFHMSSEDTNEIRGGHSISGTRIWDTGDDGVVFAGRNDGSMASNLRIYRPGSWNKVNDFAGTGVRCTSAGCLFSDIYVEDPSVFAMYFGDLSSSTTKKANKCMAQNINVKGFIPHEAGTTAVFGIKNAGDVTIDGGYIDPVGDNIYTITNAANNGSGLIRLTFSAAHNFTTGNYIRVVGVVGTTEANSRWQITVINTTTIDLDASTFTNAYVSGGTAFHSIRMARVYSTDVQTNRLALKNIVAENIENVAYLDELGVSKLEITDGTFSKYWRGIDTGAAFTLSRLLLRGNTWDIQSGATGTCPILFLGNFGAGVISDLDARTEKVITVANIKTVFQFSGKTVTKARLLDIDYGGGSVLKFSSASGVVDGLYDGDKSLKCTGYGDGVVIPSGSTSVTFAHGMGETPLANEIVITPTNSLGNATKLRVGTISASQITVHSDVDPGATTAIFSWRAKIGERVIS